MSEPTYDPVLVSKLIELVETTTSKHAYYKPASVWDMEQLRRAAQRIRTEYYYRAREES